MILSFLFSIVLNKNAVTKRSNNISIGQWNDQNFDLFWCKGPAIKKPLGNFLDIRSFELPTNFQGKCHIGVSRVKNLSTSVKRLFCVMAAINGSTGPVTVEYHEKPTGTQLNLV